MFADDLHKAETISLPVTLIILLFAVRRARRRRAAAAARPHRRPRHAWASSRGVSQFTPATDNLMVRSSCSSASPSASTTRCSTSAASARSARRAAHPEAALEAAAATSGRTVARSPASPSWPRWPACTSPATRASARWRPARSSSSASRCSARSRSCPAMLSKLGDNVDRGRDPVPRQAHAPRARVARLVLDARPRPEAPAAPPALISGGARSSRSSIPALGLHTRERRHRHGIPQNTPVMKTYNRITGGVPGRQEHRRGRREGRRRHEAARSPARSARSSRRPRPPAPRSTTSPPTSAATSTVATIDIPIAGNGNDAKSEAALDVAARRHRPGDGRAASAAPRRSSAATPPRARTTTTC